MEFEFCRNDKEVIVSSKILLYFFIIQCSGNNLDQIALSKLLYRIKWDIKLLASVFPDYQLVWSFILPQITRKYSRNPRSMEQARKKVNSLAAKEVLSCGRRKLRHPQFFRKPHNLYSLDGVHLSKLGNYLFEQYLGSIRTFC